MYCPKKFCSNTLNRNGDVMGECKCEEVKCKWYEPVTKTCAMATYPIIEGREIEAEQEE